MRKRGEFTNEFKVEAVKLAERGGTPAAGWPATWAGPDGAAPLDVPLRHAVDGTRLTPDEREELIRLRRENKRLTMERDILKKAVGIFSKELPRDTASGTKTSSSSSSPCCAGCCRRRRAATMRGGPSGCRGVRRIVGCSSRSRRCKAQSPAVWTAPRHAQLRQQGRPCSCNRVARLMRRGHLWASQTSIHSHHRLEAQLPR